MDILLQGIFLVLGLFIGVFIGKLLFSSKYSASEIEALNTAKIQFETENKSLKLAIIKFEENTKFEQEKLQNVSNEKIKLEENLKSSLEKFSKQEEEIKQLNQRFLDEFKNVSNQIFTSNSNKLNEQASLTIENLLKPFKENLHLFEKKVDENLLKQLTDTTQLKEQIKTLQDSNQKISTDANNLATALRGNSKTRGSWGEGILERILDMSGLIENQDYTMQKSFTSEDNNRLIPDVIIKLPNNRHVIIDSKVSLIAYDKYISAKDEKEESEFIKEHLTSLSKHIADLSKKDYPKIDGSNLDFTLLFVPIEPSLELAYKNKPSLYNEAFEKNILLITPTTLIATLRMINVIWKQEKQNKNVQDIAKQAGTMLNKFKGFIEDMKGIDDGLSKAKSKYDSAFKKLSEGSGNLVSQAVKLERLGANSKSSQFIEFVESDEE